MNKIPCKLCISYAICKHKQIIKCNILNDWKCKQKDLTISKGLNYDHYWKYVSDVLPTTVWIFPEGRDKHGTDILDDLGIRDG